MLSMQPDDKQPPLSLLAVLGRLTAIGAILCTAAVLFVYVGGWLSPDRRTQDRFMTAFEAHDGRHPGFRRNHAKGVCVTGWFDAAGEAASLSRAAIFHLQRVPIVGRFALAGGMPFAADEAGTVRSMALRFLPIGAQEWRTGMNDIPVFAVNSNEGFYDQLQASVPDPATGKPDPESMKDFLDRHPETARAMQLIKARSISSGFADDTYNSLDAFFLTNSSGVTVPVRWSAVAMQPFVADAGAHAGAEKDYLFDELVKQLGSHVLKWRLVFTIGEAGDSTQDATLAWPKERRQVDAGVVTIARAMSEENGACNDVNYDPTVLPDGIYPSDDPLLAARSSVYARSFTLRSAEKSQKPASAVSPVGIGGSAP
jgi:catalase